MIELQELQIEHYLGRAKDPVQDYLVHKLLYPKVYLDADWDGRKLDVLAVDRAGMGDVHAVKLVPWVQGQADDIPGWYISMEQSVQEPMRELSTFPSHFRYLTIVCSEPNRNLWIPGPATRNNSLAPDGVGRIGILYVDVTEENAEVKVLLKAERFRNSKELVEMADQFIASHTANWEYREEL
jgi:hypothetical protein